LVDAIKAKDTTQSELDDLLIVFGDLEEKVEKYKVCLSETAHVWDSVMTIGRLVFVS
jgi:hypothetical protein